VTFIDQAGEAALAEIMSQGAELIASGLYTKQRLGDLRNECNLLIPNTRRGNRERR